MQHQRHHCLNLLHVHRHLLTPQHRHQHLYQRHHQCSNLHLHLHRRPFAPHSRYATTMNDSQHSPAADTLHRLHALHNMHWPGATLFSHSDAADTTTNTTTTTGVLNSSAALGQYARGTQAAWHECARRNPRRATFLHCTPLLKTDFIVVAS